METSHRIFTGAAQSMDEISDNTIDLVVTSPPYPMVEMWDQVMSLQNPGIGDALANSNGQTAFELMHLELDKVWQECSRVLKPGAFCCINIGDATRTIGAQFSLYPNHSRIINTFLQLDFLMLPAIIWRKSTNSPNKFMGSGMLPAGAYVTLEHEWILVFRKKGKRVFNQHDRELRKQSAIFWEERNRWFSDLWETTGIRQSIHEVTTRKRTAAFPFEVPYRLINMYSLINDLVLDPFGGTGTTMTAAITSQRNSIVYEIDPEFSRISAERMLSLDLVASNHVINKRLQDHKAFITKRISDKGEDSIKYFNHRIQLPVITQQETNLEFSYLSKLSQKEHNIVVSYDKEAPATYQPPVSKNPKQLTIRF